MNDQGRNYVSNKTIKTNLNYFLVSFLITVKLKIEKFKKRYAGSEFIFPH